MKRNINIMLMCAAFGLCIALAGCQKDDTTVVKAAAPTGPDMSGAGKPAGGGAVFTPPHAPAPAGVTTGNYAGGKKD